MPKQIYTCGKEITIANLLIEQTYFYQYYLTLVKN